MENVLGRTIRQLRVKKDLTLSALARKANIDQMSLWRIETGRRLSPRITTLQAIASALGVDVGALCRGLRTSPEE